MKNIQWKDACNSCTPADPSHPSEIEWSLLAHSNRDENLKKGTRGWFPGSTFANPVVIPSSILYLIRKLQSIATHSAWRSSSTISVSLFGSNISPIYQTSCSQWEARSFEANHRAGRIACLPRGHVFGRHWVNSFGWTELFREIWRKVRQQWNSFASLLSRGLNSRRSAQ